MRKLLAALLLLPSLAFAQSAIRQSGSVNAYDAPQWTQSGILQSAGTILGNTVGLGVNPFAVTDNNGLGFCSNSATTTGQYNALCIGHDSNSNGLISFNSLAGLGGKSLFFNINGSLSQYPPAGGPGNVTGPVSSTINDVACFNNTGGNLLKDCGIALLAANNLSDIASASTARTNLGLGTIATQNVNAVAITGGSISGVTYGGLGTMSTQNANAVAITGGTEAGVTITGGTVAGLSAPIAHGSGGTDVSSPGTNGNLLTSNGTNWTSAALTLPSGVPSNNAVTVTSLLAINSGNAATYCGKTIQAGGGAFYAITITGPGSFPSSCLIKITNADNRGKSLQVSGFNTRILWPGHTVEYAINGSIWEATPGTEPRFMIDCSVYAALCPSSGSGYSAYIYVDATSGNDSNDCLAVGSGACATLSAAAHLIYSSFDFGNGGYPVISIGPNNATLAGAVFQGPFPGAAVLFLVCNTGVTLTPTGNGAVIEGSDGATLEIGLNNVANSNCKVDGTGVNGSVGVFAHQNIIDINGITFGSFPSGEAVFADNTASIHLNQSYTIAGGGGNFATIGPGAYLSQNGSTTVTFSGSPSISELYSISGAGAFVSLAPSITFTGAATIAQQCGIVGPAALAKNGNTLPTGTSGCLTSNGGQVY